MIRIRGARVHNLKDLSVELPRNSLTVITGVSGSGKSSLAFDTLFREGQRRFLEALPSFTRQFVGRLAPAEVEHIEGLGPAIALGQRSATPNPRSTVGTLTEAWDLLRLLYARLGKAPEGIRPSRGLFSFNGEAGACPACKGLGVEDRLDLDLLVADPRRSLREGALRVSTPNGYLMYSQVTLAVLDEVLRAHGASVDIPWEALDEAARQVVLYGSERLKVPYGKHPLESRLKWTGITARPRPEGFYRGLVPVMEEILRGKRNDSILRFVRSQRCIACEGTRLRAEARAVTWAGQAISDLAALDVRELLRRLEGTALEKGDAAVFAPIQRELQRRIALMTELGLDYLSLERPASSLSRGELQRLRLLPLALGDLSGLLVVLDEPSAGLHPREVDGLIQVLKRLRDQGQTVLVVEHEARIAQAADWLIDLGPGPGRAGGELLWSGPPAALLARRDGPHTPIGRWLRGEALGAPRPSRPPGASLPLKGLSRHTVRGVNLDLACGALNVLCGPSGAGKTSLLEAVAERLESTPGPFKRVLRVDAEPIGRTPRSNPATYSGAFDLIRDRFAASPEAKSRGLGRTHFSFNTVGGRCEHCEGAGVVEIGMRHLGSVELTCEHCGGRRFQPEVLEVRLRDRNIADLLEGSIAEAAAHFADQPRLRRILEALCEIGLGYLPLGQPATTLSGGEAQRVKLATELARAARGSALILLDEPTTGLHAADVAQLMAGWDRLIAAGHTLLVADNDGAVTGCADRVVVLGPGSGPEGDRIVASGAPAELEAHLHAGPGAPPSPRSSSPQPDPIRLEGVETHNLRQLDLALPPTGLTVVTGPSGSGKSSLVFDTLLAEAQNRFADLVSPWARRLLTRPAEARFTRASGLQASLTVAQARGRRNPRATVGTCTEVEALLRLLYARGGTRPCPTCGVPATGRHCPAGHPLPELWAADFSPHHERGACPDCRGLGFHTQCDPERLVTHPDRPLHAGAMEGTRFGAYLGEPHGQFVATLHRAAQVARLDLSPPWRELGPAERQLAMQGSGDPLLEVTWRYRRGRSEGIHTLRTRWEGFARLVEREYERVHSSPQGEALEGLFLEQPCAACGGERLREAPRQVRLGGLSLPQRLANPLSECLADLRTLDSAPADPDRDWGRGLREQLLNRLEALEAAGVGYLALRREMASLSGGEAQRVRLAAGLVGGLVGVTYVLDEPTRGLHPRDTQGLAKVLRRLAEAGNAVVVVEHDPTLLAAADHVVQLGPGGGPEGGRLLFAGKPVPPQPQGHPAPPPEEQGAATLHPGLRIRGAHLNTLRNLDLDIPRGGLVVVSGVSGSGKSTLVHGVIAASLRRRFQGLGPTGCAELELLAPLQELRCQGQEAPALGAASNLLTRMGLAEALRKRFAATPAAKAAKLQARHFSTATPGGRCEACQGRGTRTVAMDLLPDVTVECERCGGARYTPEVLACRLEGRTLTEVLDTPLAELQGLFPAQAPFTLALQALVDLGLGYLNLGQSADTLSAGELQRLELAALLFQPPRGPLALLLDEPSRGLGEAEVPRLLAILRRLAREGHLVLLVEHRPELIAASDWVIDLGPEGGRGGGGLVVQGPPRQVAACPASFTGQALNAWI